jgi:hypothetical protein
VRGALAILALAAALAASAAYAVAPSLTVAPSVVHRGHLVTLKGSADGCPVGDAVTLISRAFVHTHDFAGVPAVFTRVRAGGKFHVSTRIPRTKPARRYAITARCGGGNLGVVAHLRVLR